MQVVIHYAVNVHAAMLQSLGSLSHLQQLDLCLYQIHPPDLQQLSGLVSLRHCDIRVIELRTFRQVISLSNIANLLVATQLTFLNMHDVEHPVGHGGPMPPTMTAAVSQLGCMACLCSLDLGPAFYVADQEFCGLSRLTQLTRLFVGGIALTSPRSGSLPLLRDLRIRLHEYWDTSLSGSQLLSSLLPLMPLPSLTRLNGGGLHVDIGHAGGSASIHRVSNDLKALANVLAKAPLLQASLAEHATLAHIVEKEEEEDDEVEDEEEEEEDGGGRHCDSHAIPGVELPGAAVWQVFQPRICKDESDGAAAFLVRSLDATAHDPPARAA